MWDKIITIKRTKYLNYFSLCALNLFNTRVSQFELNYWNKLTFPQHSNLLRCTCTCRPSRGCTSFSSFNLPQELLILFYSAIIESVLCTSITVWFSLATKSDLRRLRRVVRTAKRIIGTTLPALQELYLSRVSKRAKSLWTPHIQHTSSLNCYHLVDATELWAPERPDTETVSFPKQSISWTLDIKRGTHSVGQ